MNKWLLMLLGGMLVTKMVSAHYIWIERDGETARVYYGEFQEGERETSPGKLDKIKGLRVYTSDQKGQSKEIENRKTSEFYVANAGRAEYVLATSLEVPVADMQKYNWGIVKPMYYARHGAASVKTETKSAQALDIVPVAGSTNTFQVYFNNQPLKGEKLMVYAPNTWAKEYKTDADGKVRLETPWAGQYVLEVIHTDKTPGKFEGKDYESVRHRVTYTFVKK